MQKISWDLFTPNSLSWPPWSRSKLIWSPKGNGCPPPSSMHKHQFIHVLIVRTTVLARMLGSMLLCGLFLLGSGMLFPKTAIYPFPRLLDNMPPCFHSMENFASDGFKMVLINVCQVICTWNRHTWCEEKLYALAFDFSSTKLSISLLQSCNVLPKATYVLWQWVSSHSHQVLYNIDFTFGSLVPAPIPGH